MTVTSEDELSMQTICSGVAKGTATLTTTTPSTIITIPTASNTIYRVSVYILGFRTDTPGNSWSRYTVATFFNSGGTLTQTGSTSNVTTDGTGGASAYGISGTNIIFTTNPSAGAQTWNFTAFATYYKGV